MAPARGAQAQGPGQAHGVPRDHQGRHQRRRREHARARPARSSTRRRHAASSTVSTGGMSRDVTRRKVRPGHVGRPRPVRSDATGRRPRARAHGVRLGVVLGSRSARREVGAESFATRLARIDGAPLARGTDFDDTGDAQEGRASCSTRPRRANSPTAIAAVGEASVSNLESKPGTRSPKPPFTTSTLQQEAGRKLSMSAKHAMSVAQRLYEKGFITYMRTDSTALSTQAVQAARAQAVALYGDKAVPANPRTYRNKSKNAQEAHEAIRPSGEDFRTPVVGLRRTRPRRAAPVRPDLEAHDRQPDVGREVRDHDRHPRARRRRQRARRVHRIRNGLHLQGLPRGLRRGPRREARRRRQGRRPVAARSLAVRRRAAPEGRRAKGHSTSPKPRYTEASLVKALEEKGIGRPSTFASIIDVIINRGYVTKRGQALVPSWLAFSIVRLLEEHFADLVDYDFTAALEDDLDAIARGEQKRVEWLQDFYFGSEIARRPAQHRRQPRRDRRARAELDADRRMSRPLRFGRTGRTSMSPIPTNPDAEPRRVNIPEDLAPDELTADKAQELIDAPVAGDRVLGENPETGQAHRRQGRPVRPVRRRRIDPTEAGRVDEATGEVIEPRRRSGRAKKDAAPKPRTASLFKSMSPDTIDLDTALQLLALPAHRRDRPRDRAAHHRAERPLRPVPQEGHRLADARRASSSIFDITLEQALAIYAQPKYGARGASQRAEGVRDRPGQRQADQAQRRSVRGVRHRRRDERHDPARRDARRHHLRDRRADARRQAREGTRSQAHDDSQSAGTRKAPAKK